MASIDDLFRRPNAPPKRKLDNPSLSFLQHHQQQSNKAAKLSNGSSPQSTAQDSKAASVQDESVEDEDDDIAAGPTLPPEENEEPDEDDEGRFFGGGVSKQERDVLDFIDQNEEDEAHEQKIDISWLKKTAINLKRKINKNVELRAKFENDPMKFVGSEADLDGEIKNLSLLSEHPDLYKDFIELGCLESLVGLLAHDNTDIAISVCEILEELTDEDSGAQEEQWEALVDAMMEVDTVGLLISNLERFDETNEADRAGIYHVLSVVENLSSEKRNVEHLGRNDRMLEWLKGRIETQDPDARARVGQNRQYSAEILAILLQDNQQIVTRFTKLNGVDLLLQLLSAYRKKDPEKDSDEQEFVENLFDCLVSLVKDTVGAERFLEDEGVELCLIMLREGKFSKSRALRVLDHALGGKQGGLVGERLVDAAGLKTIFSVFMKSKKQERASVEHLIGIFASLLRYLPAESAARIRTLAKFVENDYEKTAHLVQLREDIASRVAAVDTQIEREKQSLSVEDVDGLESEWLSRRFDAGLFQLQALDVVLAWIIAEDDGARERVAKILEGKGEARFGILRESLEQQMVGLDSDQGRDTQEMLEALLRCLY